MCMYAVCSTQNRPKSLFHFLLLPPFDPICKEQMKQNES